jgi:hypothetical protein
VQRIREGCKDGAARFSLFTREKAAKFGIELLIAVLWPLQTTL